MSAPATSLPRVPSAAFSLSTATSSTSSSTSRANSQPASDPAFHTGRLYRFFDLQKPPEKTGELTEQNIKISCKIVASCFPLFATLISEERNKLHELQTLLKTKNPEQFISKNSFSTELSESLRAIASEIAKLDFEFLAKIDAGLDPKSIDWELIEEDFFPASSKAADSTATSGQATSNSKASTSAPASAPTSVPPSSVPTSGKPSAPTSSSSSPPVAAASVKVTVIPAAPHAPATQTPASPNAAATVAQTPSSAATRTSLPPAATSRSVTAGLAAPSSTAGKATTTAAAPTPTTAAAATTAIAPAAATATAGSPPPPLTPNTPAASTGTSTATKPASGAAAAMSAAGASSAAAAKAVDSKPPILLRRGSSIDPAAQQRLLLMGQLNMVAARFLKDYVKTEQTNPFYNSVNNFIHRSLKPSLYHLIEYSVNSSSTSQIIPEHAQGVILGVLATLKQLFDDYLQALTLVKAKGNAFKDSRAVEIFIIKFMNDKRPKELRFKFSEESKEIKKEPTSEEIRGQLIEEMRRQLTKKLENIIYHRQNILRKVPDVSSKKSRKSSLT